MGEQVVGHLFGVFGCHGLHNCRLAMLTVYFDESGIHEGDHLCVVAGFVGDEDQWTAFVAEWTEALKPRKNLHLSDLRWNQQTNRIARLLARLGPIPERHGLTRIVGGIWHRDYHAVVEPRAADKFAKPWMFATQVCIHQTLRFIPKDERIAFVFEEQRGYKEVAHALYEQVFRLGQIDQRVVGLSFVKKNSTICIDPADYLAFEVREYEMDKNSLRAKLGLSILGNGEVVGHIWEAAQIQKVVDVWGAKGV